ncbi:MAG: hypothetical protein AAB486_03855 [Patescibacteria group bacterium]
MQITTLQSGKWTVNMATRIIVFPRWAVEAGRELLPEWQRLFPKEETWVQREVGTPSLIVRLDCTIVESALRVFEIEERPAGIGITGQINPQFRERLEGLRVQWPLFSVVVSKQRQGCDDNLWAQILGLDEYRDGLVMVRAEPEEPEFHRLTPFSVSSVRMKGNKSYGVDLDWWRRVASPEELPWDEPFVLKPLQGSKCHDLEVWVPKTSRHFDQVKGASTRTRVARTLLRNGAMYCQPFHSPMSFEDDPRMRMILRVYYGYEPQASSWQCLGGVWNARPNWIVHGASDAVFGPIQI